MKLVTSVGPALSLMAVSPNSTQTLPLICTGNVTYVFPHRVHVLVKGLLQAEHQHGELIPKYLAQYSSSNCITETAGLHKTCLIHKSKSLSKTTSGLSFNSISGNVLRLLKPNNTRVGPLLQKPRQNCDVILYLRPSKKHTGSSLSPLLQSVVHFTMMATFNFTGKKSQMQTVNR